MTLLELIKQIQKIKGHPISKLRESKIKNVEVVIEDKNKLFTHGIKKIYIEYFDDGAKQIVIEPEYN